MFEAATFLRPIENISELKELVIPLEGEISSPSPESISAFVSGEPSCPQSSSVRKTSSMELFMSQTGHKSQFSRTVAPLSLLPDAGPFSSRKTGFEKGCGVSRS